MSKLSLIEEKPTWGIERSDRTGRSSHRPGRYVIAQLTMCRRPVRYPRRSVHFMLIVPADREIVQDDQAIFNRPRTSSLSSTCLKVEGKRGRAREREGEICEGEFVRGFTKVAPSKGSVHLLRATSQIFEGLGGVHFSKKRRFSAGFGWKQKEVRFSASFRRKRKESKVLCLTGARHMRACSSKGETAVVTAAIVLRHFREIAKGQRDFRRRARTPIASSTTCSSQPGYSLVFLPFVICLLRREAEGGEREGEREAERERKRGGEVRSKF
ncbi:hypothetical protein M5K25_007049 [Dendrobium thyrsiflorum]|uniref:Uncharacterized protein n=1 Tax=Dendrobium thyrsiflorum TaxID=117978 RepID=A0ABD0VKB5_DENTH